MLHSYPFNFPLLPPVSRSGNLLAPLNACKPAVPNHNMISTPPPLPLPHITKHPPPRTPPLNLSPSLPALTICSSFLPLLVNLPHTQLANLCHRICQNTPFLQDATPLLPHTPHPTLFDPQTLLCRFPLVRCLNYLLVSLAHQFPPHPTKIILSPAKLQRLPSSASGPPLWWSHKPSSFYPQWTSMLSPPPFTLSPKCQAICSTTVE